MKIALDWIADYLSPTPDAARAADALMNAGLPVESIEDADGAKGPTKVLDVEVTSNRTDCFSHVGLARELSALTGGNFSLPRVAITESGDPASSTTRVEVSDTTGCPYYSARIIRGVKVGPSPDWLVKRLESIGLRSINNVVDVTNYVLMELGQPLHAFDYDLLAEKRIVVRRANKGEKMVAIDGKEYPLDPSMLVIADAQNPVAIAGVMGGKATEVTERTTTVLLESARFEPLTIRTTSRTLGLKSDSSYRFERGIDPTMAELAGKRAAQLIVQVAGGSGGGIAPGVVTVGDASVKSKQVGMRFKRYEEIMGVPVAPDRAEGILAALGFDPWVDDQPETEKDVLYTRIPPHRLDVEREIDLIEEVARVHGFQHVPTLDRVTHPVRPEPAAEKAGRVIMNALVEAGFSEAVTVTFVPEADSAPFVSPGATLIHPQHAGWKSDVLRSSLLPSLLMVRRTNQNVGVADAALCEKAEIFQQRGDPLKNPPTVQRVIAAVAGELSSLTGLAALIVDRLNSKARVRVEPQDYPFFVQGASGNVLLEIGGAKTVIGWVGLFTPEMQRKYDLRHAVAGVELDWDALVNVFQPVRRANPVPRFPGVERDLSIVVDETVRWVEVEAAVVGANLPSLASVNFVTTFRNRQLGDGKKSLTLKLEFRDPARTLTSEEVDPQVATVVKLLGGKFAAALRA
ncbi:MAG TPA: phenylalanine--tRNA ligase subunit beta [Phycisphaerae bacterium]|nr:phenylalanine--tRNA ligase subunit beta [Phycisphaerae bacterium]